jgi:K+-sensing histidine kinase KdpD
MLAMVFREFPVTSALLCLLAVSLVAQTLGTVAGLFLTLVCSLLLLWLVFPLNPFLVSPVPTSAFLLVAGTLCLLQGRLPAARRGESRALALVALSRELSETATEDEVWSVLNRHLLSEFGRHELVVGLAQAKDQMAYWHPLPDGLGQVGLAKPPEEKALLEAFLLYSAQAIGRQRLNQKIQEAELVKARESLYRALLDSISHDLRIPLVSITGVLSGLLDENFSSDPATRKDLLENAFSEAERLRRLVENLLQMTRLEAGALKVVKKPYDLWEVVTAVLDGLALQLAGRTVNLEVPDQLPLVPQDPILIGQVLRNLLDNAIKYSPPNDGIEVEISLLPDWVEVAVVDSGQGLTPGQEQKVFEKFFRGQNQKVHGSGLGLSICEGLVAAHGGFITIEGRKEGGTRAAFRLPLREEPCSKS